MGEEGLAEWHERLHARFGALRGQRSRGLSGSPVFALEHGLTDPELGELSAAVRAAIASSARLPSRAWLPVVVYAAEVGYRYEGEEYWPVFEADTPGWRRRGANARVYVRKKYETFAADYGGARPSGRWAAWFKNIAWPITHAILPTDLQRHLARLLSDYRHAFTAELLQDHKELGERLAARSQNTSARFRKFAENEALLGLVAASLLLGDEDETPLLSPEVLHRIVVDLSHERQAGAWLRDAKRAAVRVRRKGLLSSTSGQRSGSERDRDRAFAPLEASLSLRRSAGGWTPYVEIPSFAPLATRFPATRDDLERSRCRIRGVSRVRPQGSLMYPQGPLRLDQLPEVGQSLVQFETASAHLSALSADHCRMPPAPWLYRLRDSGIASEVRTKSVRPGSSYLLHVLGEPPALQSLESRVCGLTVGGCLLEFWVPDEITETQTAELRSARLSISSKVSAWPAGLVPAGWDGEGTATWVAGESPIIGIRTEEKASRCIVATSEELKEVPWPAERSSVFVQLRDLPEGDHLVDVGVFRDDGTSLAQGQLRVRILEPIDSAEASNSRQGLQVRAYPARPSLEELWSGSAVLVADGPPGERATFHVALVSRAGRTTHATASFSSELPVSADRWAELLRGAKGDLTFASRVGISEEIRVAVSNPDLGSAEIRADRPFEPIRWVAGVDRDGPHARLINHVEEAGLKVSLHDVTLPADAVDVGPDDDGCFRAPNGGLLLASHGELESGIVLPPLITGGLESLRKLNPRPSLQIGPRSAHSIRRAIDLDRRWTTASAADDNARRLQAAVNDAVVARIAGTVAGDRWWAIELDVLNRKPLPSSVGWLDSLGHSSDERMSAGQLIRSLEDPPTDPHGSVALLCSAISGSKWHGDVSAETVEAVVRLASVPGALSPADAIVSEAVNAVLAQPGLLRLARVLVLNLTSAWGAGRSVLEMWSWA